MREATEEGVRLIRSTKGAVALWSPEEQRLVRNSLRAGVWGIGGGTAVALLGAIGAQLPLHWLWVGVGLTSGGLAAAVASAAILKKAWKGRRLRHLTVAGALGVPFGLSAAVLGVGWLFRDLGVGAAAPFALPVLLISGMALTGLFGSGAFRHFRRLPGAEGEGPRP